MSSCRFCEIKIFLQLDTAGGNVKIPTPPSTSYLFHDVVLLNLLVSPRVFKSRSIRLIASSLLSPCQNNGTYVLKLHISPSAFILTKAGDYNSRDLQGSTGVVTLLLPSTRPQIFTYTVQLYSVEGAQHSFVSCLERKIHVPGPWLEEYQEGPAIEHPIRKIRPRGQLL